MMGRKYPLGWVKLVTIVFTIVMLAPKSYAGGGPVPSPYATEFTQYLNYLQLINITIKQAETVANQIQSIKYQVEQLKSIKRLDVSEWGKAMTVLQQLDNIVRQGRALSYTLQNVEQVFKQTFPGYKPSNDYIHAYQDWSEITLDSIQGTLAAAGFQSHQFTTENATLETIRMFSENAVGQTQAIQASSMIANEMVGQLQKLRQLHMAQIQAQSAYMSYEVQRDATGKASLNRFFKVIPYQKSQSKGY